MNFVKGRDAFRHFADAIGGPMHDAAKFAQAFDPRQMKCAEMDRDRCR
jgi:hypothetical protein